MDHFSGGGSVIDPDGNDLELYYNRAESKWSLGKGGHLAFVGKPADTSSLL
jgi:catechol-2,3-dioxygenase